MLLRNTKVKLKKLGKNISKAEVVQISPHGIWLLVSRKEYFLSYEDFPWFKRATVAQISKLKLLNERHLHWPDLDVGLEMDTLKNLEQYPLVYK